MRHTKFSVILRDKLLIPARRPDLVITKKKKRTCHLVDCTIQVDHRVEREESKTIDKYLDFA